MLEEGLPSLYPISTEQARYYFFRSGIAGSDDRNEVAGWRIMRVTPDGAAGQVGSAIPQEGPSMNDWLTLPDEYGLEAVTSTDWEGSVLDDVLWTVIPPKGG